MRTSDLSWSGMNPELGPISSDATLAKNHSVISSQLYALRSLLSKEPEARQRFCAHMRILAALQHNIRKQLKAGQEPESISLESLLSGLDGELKRVARPLSLSLHTEVTATLPLRQCVALLLLLTELVANAGQHGAGEIVVSVRRLSPSQEAIPTLLCLEVSDQGDGFPVDFELQKHAKLGLELVEVLCRWDLGGELVFQNNPAGGACVQLYFPISCP